MDKLAVQPQRRGRIVKMEPLDKTVAHRQAGKGLVERPAALNANFLPLRYPPQVSRLARFCAVAKS
ncbi:hypothetical protein ABID26_007182 [Mesorhizobium shonense]|uniref:Uncharacterized protein n=1 Tax=Mesorhizobium shonense TaxID=1209948 RepID=A0ABV2I4D2_9HYPH